MEPDRQRRDLGDGLLGAALGAGLTTAAQRCRDLLDQPDLAVGGSLERSQVPRPDAVRRELGDRAGDDDRVVVVRRGAGRAWLDQPEGLELGEQVLGDLGRGEQLAAGEPEPGVVGALAWRGATRPYESYVYGT